MTEQDRLLCYPVPFFLGIFLSNSIVFIKYNEIRYNNIVDISSDVYYPFRYAIFGTKSVSNKYIKVVIANVEKLYIWIFKYLI